MRHFYITLLLIGIACVNAGATISFTDSITGVTLNFPDNVEIKSRSATAYKKLEVALPDNGYLSVYSVLNRKNETYDWAYINKFDKSYGTPREKERLSGDVNGWIRLYDFKTDKGTPYIRCVTLIRGVNYAFYIEENAWSVDKLITRELVANSTFPMTIDNHKRVGPRNDTIPSRANIVLLILLAIGLLLRFFRNSLSDTYKWLIISVCALTQSFLLFFVEYCTLWISFCCGACLGFIIYLFLYCPTWDDFWAKFEKYFGKADN